MRSLLRVTALVLFLVALGWWAESGAHRGWTKTTDRIWKYDEITEISYPETVKRFIPGVDLLAAATLASLLLAGGSFAFRKKSPLNPNGHPS